jgi:hypothetical protein
MTGPVDQSDGVNESERQKDQSRSARPNFLLSIRKSRAFKAPMVIAMICSLHLEIEPQNCKLRMRRRKPVATKDRTGEGLVDAGCSLPIDNVNQLPRIPDEIPLQLPVLIDHELSFRVQEARALTLIGVIQVEFSNR